MKRKMINRMSKMTENVRKWIRKFRSGKIWINKLVSDATINSYLPLFKRFCELTGKDPDELIAYKMEGMRLVGTEKEFQAEELYEDVIKNQVDGEHARANIATAVLSFYKHNRRPLSEPMKFEKPESEGRQPTLEDVETMANYTRTKRDKALIWCQASCPLREGTLEKLIWGDLRETGDSQVPIMIVVKADRLKGSGRGRYKGTFHIGFWHAHAWKLFQDYRKEALRKLRKKYPDFEITSKTSLWLSYVNGNGTVKGLGKFGISEIFEKASFSAWGEEKKFRPHDYRDFLDNALRKSGILKIDRDPMLSHKMKGVEKHYQTNDPEDEGLQTHLREQFKKALSLITTSPQITEKDRIMGVKAEFDQRTQLIIAENKAVINRYEAEIEHWKGMIEITETTKKLEPQKAKEYDELIQKLRKQILTAEEQISMLKDSVKRLEKIA